MTTREVGLACVLLLSSATHFLCCSWEQSPSPGPEQDLARKLRTVWHGNFGGMNHRIVLSDSFDVETAHFIGVKCPVALVLIGTILLLRGDRKYAPGSQQQGRS